MQTHDNPEHPIKMIALDLDGTLLRSDKTVGPRTIEALRAAHRSGVEIALASGRMTPAMERAAEALELDVCIVSYNGAAVCGRASQGRKRLVHQPLHHSVAAELYTYAKPRGHQVNYYINDMIISEDAPHLRPYIDLYRDRTGSPFEFVDSLKDYQHHSPTKLLFVTSEETRTKIEAEVRPLVGSRAMVVRTEHEYLEFLDPQVTKGWGVVQLSRILGIPMHAIMAMGDGENDVEMLQMCGWAVAPVNALPPAKKAANAVLASTNDEEAVAEAVERWVLK